MEADLPRPAPAWALLERHLIETVPSRGMAGTRPRDENYSSGGQIISPCV